MKTLYVSDLDGTLLTPEALISDKSRQLLNETISEGALLTIATARTPATVSRLLNGIYLPVPAIVMTGAALWNSHTGEYSDIKHISRDASSGILSALRATDLPAFLYTLRDNHITIYHSGQLNDMEKKFISERIGSPFKSFDIPASGCSDIPAEALDNTILFYAMQPTENVLSTFSLLEHIPDCRPSWYHDMYGMDTALMEIFSPAASKAAAVKKLAESAGVERIVVFGDNVNDQSMMEIADLAVAVDNAIDETKEKADIVIGKNSEDAVAEFIYSDFRKNTL